VSGRARHLAALALVLWLAACTGPAPAADGVGGEVVVLAAASLTDAFTALGERFEAAHPGAAVVLSFAGSQSLATQIIQGVPADVVASADVAQVQRVAAAGLVRGRTATFATNRLAIAVEAGNPRGVSGLADLADPGLVLVLAAPEVPAGRLAARALAAAGVEVTPASLEVDVRAVLAKVELGEADAGIVYASDLVTAGPSVEGVDVPEAADVRASYPIAVLAEAPNPAGAAAFVALVLSAEGQAVLAQHGFGRP
jgi:molybdate transport system substrate-binding protein